MKFSYNLEGNLLNLQKELSDQTYRHGSYREFIVCDSKKRKIKAAPFRDRVVHHALCNIIEPIFDQGFIFDTYACRKEKGTHKAIERLDKFLKSIPGELYVLQCDISKYFDNINHRVLLEMIGRKIADKKTAWLIEKIVSSNCEKSGAGIPIGNLTSQLFANIYLNELDQFVKHDLRVRYYIRYMDDFLILGYNKSGLQELKLEIQRFLRANLSLEFHPKKANVFPAEKGINFLGYVSFGNYRLLRKSTVKRFIKRTKKELNGNSARSWANYAKFGNSWRLRKNLEKKFKIKLI